MVSMHQIKIFCDLTLLLNISLGPGKTNKGRTLYGRATRHKDVCLCPIGSLSFYLSYRFSVTSEFQQPDFQLEDWLENARWFDVKLLTNVYGDDFKKPMGNTGYGPAMKSVLNQLNIPSAHKVHFGRNLGPKILEMLEEESEAIRKLGNWNPSIQDQCYSTKLPLPPIRKLAGFSEAHAMYYNPRTDVMPPIELQESTTIGKFAIPAVEYISKCSVNTPTAMNFLRFMVELNIVFLQDTAAMLILHPERSLHPLFQLPELRSPQFQVCKA